MPCFSGAWSARWTRCAFPSRPTTGTIRSNTPSTSRQSGNLDFQFTDVQQLIREVAQRFAREQVAPNSRSHDRQDSISFDLLREMAALGLMGINVPSQWGGSAAGAVAYALAMMEISSACASTSVVMAVTNMCAELIALFGTEAQKAK